MIGQRINIQLRIGIIALDIADERVDIVAAVVNAGKCTGDVLHQIQKQPLDCAGRLCTQSLRAEARGVIFHRHGIGTLERCDIFRNACNQQIQRIRHIRCRFKPCVKEARKRCSGIVKALGAESLYYLTADLLCLCLAKGRTCIQLCAGNKVTGGIEIQQIQPLVQCAVGCGKLIDGGQSALPDTGDRKLCRVRECRAKLLRKRLRIRPILAACGNGSSELMSNISMSLVGMLYNAQLMRYGGQNGIAAYGVLMYVSMIFHACFIGYAVGVSPVVSFHFGAQNRPELHSLLRKSLRLIGGSSIAMLAAGEALARPLGQIFVGYDEALLAMTVRAFRIYSFSFLLAGVAILGSSFFTALNDGLTSALISFLRTLVFQIAAVLLLPLVLELDGIWLSIVFAETMAVLVTTVFLLAKRKKYGY